MLAAAEDRFLVTRGTIGEAWFEVPDSFWFAPGFRKDPAVNWKASSSSSSPNTSSGEAFVGAGSDGTSVLLQARSHVEMSYNKSNLAISHVEMTSKKE